MRIAVTCGGTGGHMFPGIAVADELQKQGHDVRLILSGRGVEAGAPDRWQDKIIVVPAKTTGVKGKKKIWRYVRLFLYSTPIAFFKLLKFRPKAILAMGSYTSIAPITAAFFLRIPRFLHESNVLPGAANKLASRLATKVFVAFDASMKYFKKGKCEVVGMPIRENIVGVKWTKPENAFTITIMGGSQGSQAVNQKAADAMKQLVAEGLDINVIHIAGKANEADVKAMYPENFPAEVYGFTDKMPEIYSRTSLCISRAGAASCFELCTCGIPSIMIPLPREANDHQRYNAQAMEEWGASKMLLQDSLTSNELAATIRVYYNNRELLEKMSFSAFSHNAAGSSNRVLASILLK